jgi:hypothetical protein
LHEPTSMAINFYQSKSAMAKADILSELFPGQQCGTMQSFTTSLRMTAYAFSKLTA